MNSKKITFITCVFNERQYKECVLYINSLDIPLGFEIETISVRATKSIAEAYNKGLSLTDAKYKVYLQDNTFIINKEFIKDILEIFILDITIGLIGVAGAKRLPSSGIWWEDAGKVGEVYDTHRGFIEHLKFNNIIEKYEIVESIDGLIMVTQTDIKWREDIFDGLSFYDVSLCMEFKKNGFLVVVPRQEKPWCIHECGTKIENSFEEYRKKFLVKYPVIQNRNTYLFKDLFNFNREEAMQALVENKKVLVDYMYWMKNCIALGDYESASRNAFDFASKASLHHPGFFSSPQIENMLLVCANDLPQKECIIKSNSYAKRRVLHVLSEGYSTGGHTRLVKNWIKSDTDSVHSLVTTWQINSTPAWLIEEVKKSGGSIYSLDTVSDKYIERAAELRKISYEWADVVVLHMHMMDPIPVMAFGVVGGPPVIYLNHGDHCFWLGASIADLVVDLRPCGQQLTLTRRGASNSYILPIPLEARKAFDKNQIREKYGIKEEETVILTIATHYKFRSINENSYINIIKEVVDKVDNCTAFIIGPSNTGKWHEINALTGGKIKALGLLNEIEDFYQLADVYLDCFMMGSLTSLLDASIHGLPIIKFTNSHCLILTEFDEEFEVCSYEKIDDIIRDINELKNNSNKYKSINDSIRKNHILDTQEKIKYIYSTLDNHRVNRELKISNKIEDYDLFWSLLIKSGYVY